MLTHSRARTALYSGGQAARARFLRTVGARTGSLHRLLEDFARGPRAMSWPGPLSLGRPPLHPTTSTPACLERVGVLPQTPCWGAELDLPHLSELLSPRTPSPGPEHLRLQGGTRASCLQGPGPRQALLSSRPLPRAPCMSWARVGGLVATCTLQGTRYQMTDGGNGDERPCTWGPVGSHECIRTEQVRLAGWLSRSECRPLYRRSWVRFSGHTLRFWIQSPVGAPSGDN